jgi:hypothetical protein
MAAADGRTVSRVASKATDSPTRPRGSDKEPIGKGAVCRARTGWLRRRVQEALVQGHRIGCQLAAASAKLEGWQLALSGRQTIGRVALRTGEGGPEEARFLASEPRQSRSSVCWPTYSSLGGARNCGMGGEDIITSSLVSSCDGVGDRTSIWAVNAGLWGKGEMSILSSRGPGEEDGSGGVVTVSSRSARHRVFESARLSLPRPSKVPRRLVVKRERRGVGS